jgi:hypothetical protein
MAVDYLDCPVCGLPCEAILCCQDAHLGCLANDGDLGHGADDPVWCEDREGTCECGARLVVRVDDESAYLEEVDDAELSAVERGAMTGDVEGMINGLEGGDV